MSRHSSIRDTPLDIMLVSSGIGNPPASSNRVKTNRFAQEPIRKRSTSAVRYTIVREATGSCPVKGGQT